jgi:hypothetical protein
MPQLNAQHVVRAVLASASWFLQKQQPRRLVRHSVATLCAWGTPEWDKKAPGLQRPA